MATRTSYPQWPPEVGRRYRLRLYLGGERIAEVFKIDSHRGLVWARDPDGHDFMWTLAMWRAGCIERIG